LRLFLFLLVTQFFFVYFQVDFTPASIDKNQEAQVTIGAKNDIIIQVPHIDVLELSYLEMFKIKILF